MKLFFQYGQAANVVVVVVRDQNGGQFLRVYAQSFQTPSNAPSGDPGI
jgi:hypothetical protein